MRTKILLRLVTLLLMTAGVGKLCAMNRTVTFANQNRISNNGAGVFTTNISGSNQFALALADLSSIPGITTAGTITIQFDSNIPSGSRWNIGIGDKDVRRANANGSSGSTYSTDGLILRFGTTDGNSYRVNGGTSNDNAFGKTVHATITFNRVEGTFTYTLTDKDDNTVYFSDTDISTLVANPTIIEVYSWQNSSSVTLSNVTIQYEDLYFEKYEDVVYIEDIEYSKLTNGTGNTATATYSTSGYFRLGGTSLYPIKTTGDNPTNLTEGDPITVTVAAGTAKAICHLRIKTRNMLDPSDMVDNTTNTFDVGSTIGLFNSQDISMTGMTLYLSYNNHTPVVRNINGAYGITIIDKNGYTFGNWANDPDTDISHEWGTVYKIITTEAKNLSVSGYFSATSAAGVQLYDDSHNAVSGKTISNPGNGTLATATFALEAGHTYYLHQSSGYDHFCLKSLSYRDAYFEQNYAVTTIGSTYSQAVQNMESPVYSIIGREGDIAVSSTVTINSSTGIVSGIDAGGALKIQATGGGKTCVYYLTVAYPATPYPGKLWEFNQYYETYQPPLSIDETGGKRGFPRIDANSDGTVIMTDGGSSPITDEHGDTWVAELKNVNYGSGRDARWQHANAVHGDNAFIVSETAGLVFNTGGKGFFVRNDREKHNCWGHVGIRQNGASFTIPQLTAGDIVEINWKRETGGAGGEYTATNVTDLRYKPVSEQFEITGSQNGTTGGVLDVYKNPGYTSFIATGGDVTFTLRDAGATDILSIRIYSGGYRSTMRPITNTSHRSPQTTMLLDYQDDAEHNYNYQEYEYDYCNVLNSTNTGPAIYVLKGYRRGEDNVECVSGTNAALSPTPFEDNDATYSAYPVTEAESQRLYDLRKNLMGFRMYNRTWQSSRNSYNNGRVGASGGWGKVTIRMNNYTNDMKYVIGYTNDVTMTFGSAPHQTYPYTWDFSKIAGGTVTGASDNVLYSIGAEGTMETFSGQAPTNWIKKDDGQFMLNTDNNGELGSQYVPGAVLVSTNRALSNFSGAADNKYAKDELDGLGFDGDITMHVDHQPNYSGWSRTTPPDKWNSLLSFKITDVATFVPREGTDPEEHDGTWNYTKKIQVAGNGRIQLNHAGGIDTDNHIDESNIPAGGIGFRLDGGDSKYIHVFPGNTLQKGDVISVTAYNAYNYRDAGISFNKSASSTDYAQRMMLSQRMVEETINYTVTTNDGLNGRADFYLYMKDNTVHITAIEISRKASSAPDLDWSIYTLSSTTITVPDLNANDKQDWIYVSATSKPTVTNATEVTSGTDGPDANTTPEVNTDIHVYKFKVTNEGDALLTFDEGTKIYKIGVTHILKEIHSVGGVGWATEIRKHDIDHELIGYFTKNDVNAYTVKYDSYDMKTATVALTPINEDGYVPEKTGIVMRLDNVGHLSDANSGKYVPLFYPSYTRPASSTPVGFPTNNLMYNVDEGIESNNRNYNETINVGSVNYTKFILTNRYWTFNKDHALSDDESASPNTADAAGFYRMHIWKSGADIETKNTMKANTAYLLVPSNNLPVAVWTLQEGYSAAPGMDLLGVYNIVGPNSETAIDELRDDGITAGGNADNCNGQTWYTVSGTKLATPPTKAGLYIRNGRKVVVR